MSINYLYSRLDLVQLFLKMYDSCFRRFFMLFQWLMAVFYEQFQSRLSLIMNSYFSFCSVWSAAIDALTAFIRCFVSPNAGSKGILLQPVLLYLNRYCHLYFNALVLNIVSAGSHTEILLFSYLLSFGYFFLALMKEFVLWVWHSVSRGKQSFILCIASWY